MLLSENNSTFIFALRLDTNSCLKVLFAQHNHPSPTSYLCSFPALLLPRLTSSFTVVIIITATRGCCLTRNTNMRINTLLSHSNNSLFSKSKKIAVTFQPSFFQPSTVKAARYFPYLCFLNWRPLVAIVIVTAAKEEVRLHVIQKQQSPHREEVAYGWLS